MGLYKRKDSRFWWMAYAVKGGQRCESTKTPIKELARKILKRREAEIVLGRFQVGWPCAIDLRSTQRGVPTVAQFYLSSFLRKVGRTTTFSDFQQALRQGEAPRRRLPLVGARRGVSQRDKTLLSKFLTGREKHQARDSRKLPLAVKTVQASLDSMLQTPNSMHEKE